MQILISENNENEQKIDLRSQDMGPEPLEGTIEFQPEFRIAAMRSPSPKNIDTLSDRDGLFSGCGGVSVATSGRGDDAGDIPQDRYRTRGVMNVRQSIDDLPNLDSRQLSEGEENILPTQRDDLDHGLPQKHEIGHFSGAINGENSMKMASDINQVRKYQDFEQKIRQAGG